MPIVWLLVTMVAQAPAVETPAAQAPAPVYVPQRVYDTERKVFTDFETMVAALTRADAVFVGEQHADPNTHRLELAILEGLRRRGEVVTVSLEMFDRDVQAALNQYLNSASSEADFLKGSRPWPRYASDYRPLVEFAKANGWAVVAANVPRRHASAVAKSGIGAIDALPEAERPHAASDVQCPRDAYFDRFATTMADHPPGKDKPAPEEERARTERYFESQCVKDETMAESIAAAIEGKAGPVVHFNGAFHSDFDQGVVERTRRRVRDRTILVLSILPVADLDTVAPSGDDRDRADYLVYTIK
jgi:uncharacterized iron-regulated protein